ncbi:MAG: epimerase [Gammaproteobacteria bacterium RIFCSPHIGHO2_12_FULL_42_10]|nr:MAG: epimerase [Gammaproteobacteria bacterium RIFCSPHIGHO2_12_FULL_42_10]
MSTNLLADDLNSIIHQTAPLWEALRNQRLFITGGTGFFGCWLLESFVLANQAFNLQAHAVVLTRNKQKFSEKCPHLYRNPALSFQEGDCRDFTYPKGTFSHIIHAATDASVEINLNQPLVMLDSIIQGTKQTLEFAKRCGAKRFLLTSSGAVYGKQPYNISHLPEDHPCQILTTHPAAAYSIGKCAAEQMSCQYGVQNGFEVKIARCFAFIGPHLPLNKHYAIGNFIRDSLQGQPIVIQGDGTPYRSYLYASDLTVALWTILFNGQALRPYNVGSDQAYSISEVAKMVANRFSPTPTIIQKKLPMTGMLPERYVPNVTRGKNELQLTQHVTLEAAIDLTKRWHIRTQQTKSMVA